MGADAIGGAPRGGCLMRYSRKLTQHSSADRSRRGAAYFLCFAKESRQRKATARCRPTLRSGFPCAAGHQRAVRETRVPAVGSDTRPARPRCCPAPLRRHRADLPCRGAGTATLRWFCPRSRRAAQGGPGPSAIDCPKHVARRAAPRSCEFRWPPDRPSSAGDPAGAASWARLSLVTFFAKTKKVTGHAALKRASESKMHRPRAAR